MFKTAILQIPPITNKIKTRPIIPDYLKILMAVLKMFFTSWLISKPKKTAKAKLKRII